MDVLPAALSILGAYLVSRYDRYSRYGWLLWIASNLLWMAWAIWGTPSGPIWGVFGQNVFFLYTSMLGYRRSKSMAPA